MAYCEASSLEEDAIWCSRVMPLKPFELMSARVKFTFVEDFDPLGPDDGIEGLHPEDFLLLLVKVGDVAKLAPGLPKAPVLPPVPLAAILDVTVGAL